MEHAGPSRHCPHSESLVPLHRMRQMAQALRRDAGASRSSRLRAAVLDLALARSAREYARQADALSRTPDGLAAWRTIAPAVEVVAVRR